MVGFRLSRVLPFFFRSRLKADGRRSAIAAPDAAVDHVEFQEPDCVGILRRQPQVVGATTCCRPFRRRGSGRWSPLSDTDDIDEGDIPPPPAAEEAMDDRYSWSKEEKYWHVIACHGHHVDEDLLPSSHRQKIDSDDGSVIFPPLDCRRRRRERRPSRLRLSRSNSSPDDDDDEDSGWFSAEEENRIDGYVRVGQDEETETLISTTDVDSSAEINASVRRKLAVPAGSRRSRRRRSIRKSISMAEGAAAVRRLVPSVPTAVAVRESFAVVKRSKDPRADFRQSMEEMVVEKEILEPAGLEQLLHCYLSLNSRRHHADIVAAFGDVWDALFPEVAGRGRGRF